MILKDRVAFVTGGGSGIGRAGALAMAREGARLVVSDLNAHRAEAVAGEIVAAGGQAEGIGLDVTDDDDLSGAIAGAATRHGRLDILHSHAGVQVAGPLLQTTTAEMDLSWRLNVRSHFVAVQAAMRVMAPARRGAVIVTASNSGVQYDRGMVAYCTTKHAVIAMARQIAVDYAGSGVRVNALCPGFVDTAFNAGFERQMGGRKALEDYVRRQIPLGRWGTPEEIGEAVLWLASDASAYMTGHALVIDGAESL